MRFGSVFARARVDWILMICLCILVVFGSAIIYSLALGRGELGGELLQKQGMAFAVGLAALYFAASFHYRLLSSYQFLLYIGGVTLLVGVLVFGTNIRGTTGWFDIGFIHLQPVEIMKVILPIVLAHYFSFRARRPLGLREVMISGCITLLPVICVLLQPDLGSACILLGGWFFLLFFAGIQKRHLLFMCVTGLLFAVISWPFLLADYQKERILTFVNPARDPQGRGYNVAQAVIAIGAGGWSGQGLGFGSQSQLRFIPESQTDFIFAVIAEELGFFGSCVIILTFGIMIARIFWHARHAYDDFAGYLLIGFGSVLFLQATINIGMNLGLTPVTGLGLPFVSYGGSSLVFMCLLMGLVQSIVIHTRSVRVTGSLMTGE